ncbi:MAG: DUF2958 domain-containing protein, partial [Acidithiobacillus sp.]|nr:DUF2958 domain-containing protein [Acidithiobacillus sp.]
MSNNPRHYFGDPAHIQRNTFSELSALTDNVSAIRLLKILESEGRDATDAEKAVLSRYTGWGGLSNLFALELPETRFINANPIGATATGPVRNAYVRTMIALCPDLIDRSDGYYVNVVESATAERLLTAEEWASARASVNNSHFTSPDVISALWDSILPVLPDGPLEILEPSAGIGNFLAFAPPSVIERATITAVELDQISGRILQKIYPDAKVYVQGFETVPLRNGAYDLIITNVPFGDYSVPDLRYGGGKLSIHDYFLERGMDLIKPDGLLAAITSRYTLDRKYKKNRETIAMKGDLVAAVRMPVNSQTGQAGVSFTEDVLFLRGRNVHRTRVDAGNEAWVETRPVELEMDDRTASQLEKRGFVDPNRFNINRYFEHFPEAVLGKMEIGSGFGGSLRLAVRSEFGRDLLADHIRDVLQALPNRITAARQRDGARQTVSRGQTITINASEVAAHKDIREMVGTVFRRKDGSFAIVEDVGLGISGEDSRELIIGDLNLSKIKQGQFALYLPVRDAWREVLAKMQDTQPAEDGTEHPELLVAQEALGRAYDAFAAQYGALTQHVKALGDDVHVSAVSSIERYDARTRTAEKSGIFYQRTITPTVEPERVDTPSDAILLSMNRFGRLDLPYMARKLDQDEAMVRSQITGGDRPLAYTDAETGNLLPAYQYLSGNVRRKLAELRNRVESEGTADLWSGNIAALESVLPDNVPISDIEVLLGADWVPISDYEAFAHEVLGAKLAVFSFVPRNNSWDVYLARIESDKQDEYGTARRPLESLLPGLLNRSDIRVFDRTADGKQVLNGEETMLANEKAKAITAAWKEWIPQDADRVARLERIYNDRFTGFVPIHVPGDGLKIEGMSDAISLRGHQNSGVMRSVLQETGIFNHEVGTGKTYTQIAAGMKLLELGLVDRAVFVVPKKTIGQFGTSAISLFPHRRIAIMDDTQTSDKDRRRRFLAALANDRYDAVILTYNGYQSLSLPLEHELAFYQDEEDTISDLISEALASDDTLSVKRMEQNRKHLLNKIAILRQKREESADKIIGQFENVLGKRIALFVDEFHNFKNDNVAVPGNSLGIKGSARAMDMRMKSQFILGNGGRFYGASGTPVANSLLEFYVLQRYFQPETLRQMGLTNALAWYQTFLVQEAEPEPDPAGQGWRVKERPFLVNASEAVMPLTAVMDTVRADDVGIPRPQATYETRVIPNSDFFNLMLSEAGERLKDIREKKVDPSVDNMLLVLHDLNRAGLDPRMMDPSIVVTDDTPCKINEVSRDVMQSLAARDGYGLQLIFCDLGIPKGARARKISNDAGEVEEISEDEAAGISASFCFYDALIDKLVASGVPRDRIATIYDAKNDNDLEKLLIRANGGDFSVMIGSTMSMGVGLNLQTHGTDVRFITVPYRPDQVEQAIGRLLRQGNLNERIKITFYTQGQPEAYRYKLLDYKSKALRAVLQADRAVRRLDLSTDLNYNETMALTMGDPRLADIFKLEDRMQKLRTLRKSYAGRRSTYSSDLHYASNSLEKQIAQLERMRGEQEVIAQIPDKAKWSARILGNEPIGPISVTSKLEPLRAMMRSDVILRYGDYPVIASAHDFGIRYLLRRTEEEAPFYVGENPSQIEAALRHWDETVAEVELRVMNTKKRIEELRALLAKPFEHDVEMEDLALEIEALRISTGLQEDADEAAIARAEAHLASIAQARGAKESITAEQVEQAAEGIETDPERLRVILERKTLLDTAERERRQATASHQVMAHSPESTARTHTPRRTARVGGAAGGGVQQMGFSALLDGTARIPDQVETRWQAPDAGTSAPARIGVIVGYDVRDMTEYADMVGSVLARVPEGMPVAIRVVSENARVSEESLRDALKTLPNVQSVLVSVEDVFADDADRIALFRENDVIVTLGAVMAQVGRSNIPLAQAVVHPKNNLNLDAAPVFGYSSDGANVPDSLRMGEVALEWEDRVRQSAARSPAAASVGVAAVDGPSVAMPAPAEAPSSSKVSEGTQGPLVEPSGVPPAAPEVLPILQAVPKAVHGILPKAQRAFVQQLLRGPEARFFSDKMRELEALLPTIPDLRETSGQGEDAVVHLHYFTASADWYITEIVRDPDYAGDAFGLADLGMGFPEMGYMSLPEIMGVAELDFHFASRPLRLVLHPNAERVASRNESGKTNAPVPDPDSSPELGDADSEEGVAPLQGVLFYRGGVRRSMMPAGRTIEEVIDYEKNELDHDIQAVAENMAYQRALPPASLQWVANTPEEASEYGDVRKVRFHDPVVMARDVLGGMLVGERTELDAALRTARAVAVEASRDLLLSVVNASEIDRVPEPLMIETLDMIRDIQRSWPDARVARARVTGGEDEDHPVVTLGLIMGVFVEPRASGGYGERLDGDRIWVFAGDTKRGISGYQNKNKVFYDASHVADKLRLAAWLKDHGAAFGTVTLRLNGEREILGNPFHSDFVETVQEGADRWLQIGRRTPMTILLEIENHKRYPGDRFTMYQAELADAGRLMDGWHAEHPNTPMLVSVRRGDYSAPLPMAAIADYLGASAAVVREAGHGTQDGEIKQLQAVDAVVYVGKSSRASHDTGKTFTAAEKEGATKPTWMFTTDKGNFTRNMKHDNERWEKWREAEADNALQVKKNRDQAVAKWVPLPASSPKPLVEPKALATQETEAPQPTQSIFYTGNAPKKEGDTVAQILRNWGDSGIAAVTDDRAASYLEMPSNTGSLRVLLTARPEGLQQEAVGQVEYKEPVILATLPDHAVLVAEQSYLDAYRSTLKPEQNMQENILVTLASWMTAGQRDSLRNILNDGRDVDLPHTLSQLNTIANWLRNPTSGPGNRPVPLPRVAEIQAGAGLNVLTYRSPDSLQRWFITGMDPFSGALYGLQMVRSRPDGRWEAQMGPVSRQELLDAGFLLELIPAETFVVADRMREMAPYISGVDALPAEPPRAATPSAAPDLKVGEQTMFDSGIPASGHTIGDLLSNLRENGVNMIAPSDVINQYFYMERGESVRMVYSDPVGKNSEPPAGVQPLHYHDPVTLAVGPDNLILVAERAELDAYLAQNPQQSAALASHPASTLDIPERLKALATPEQQSEWRALADDDDESRELLQVQLNRLDLDIKNLPTVDTAERLRLDGRAGLILRSENQDEQWFITGRNADETAYGLHIHGEQATVGRVDLRVALLEAPILITDHEAGPIRADLRDGAILIESVEYEDDPRAIFWRGGQNGTLPLVQRIEDILDYERNTLENEDVRVNTNAMEYLHLPPVRTLQWVTTTEAAAREYGDPQMVIFTDPVVLARDDHGGVLVAEREMLEVAARSIMTPASAASLSDDAVDPVRVHAQQAEQQAGNSAPFAPARAEKAGLSELAQEGPTYQNAVEAIESAGGWDAVADSPALQKSLQDQLDHLIQMRAEQVSQVLQEGGWKWSGAAFSRPDAENGMGLHPGMGFKIFPNGRSSGGNMVHWGYRITRRDGETPTAIDIEDEMTLDAQGLVASMLDQMETLKQVAEPAPSASNAVQAMEISTDVQKNLNALRPFVSDRQFNAIRNVLSGESGLEAAQSEAMDLARLAQWISQKALTYPGGRIANGGHLAPDDAAVQGVAANCVLAYQNQSGTRKTYLTGMDDLGNLYGIRIRTRAIAGPVSLANILNQGDTLNLTMQPTPVAELLKEDGYLPEGVSSEPAVYAIHEPYRDAIARILPAEQVQFVLNLAVSAMPDDWTGSAHKIQIVERALRTIPDETLRMATLENLKTAADAVEQNRHAEAVRAGLADDPVPEAPQIDAGVGLTDKTGPSLATPVATLQESIITALQGVPGLTMEPSPHATEVLVTDSRSQHVYSITQQNEDFRVHVKEAEKEDYEDRFATLDDAMDFVRHEIFTAREIHVDESSPYYQALLNTLPGMPEAERKKMFLAVTGVMPDDWTGTLIKRRVVSRVANAYAAHFPASVTVDQVMERLVAASTRVNGLDLADMPLSPAAELPGATPPSARLPSASLPAARPFGTLDPIASVMLKKIEDSPYSLPYLLGDDRARDVDDPPYEEDAEWAAARVQFADEIDAVLNARIRQNVDALGERGWMQPILHGDLTRGGAAIHLEPLQGSNPLQGANPNLNTDGDMQGLVYRVSLAADTEGRETRSVRDYLRSSSVQFADELHGIAEQIKQNLDQRMSVASVADEKASRQVSLDDYVVAHIWEHAPMVAQQAKANALEHFLLGNVLGATSNAILDAIEDETLPQAVRDAAKAVLQGREGMTDYRERIGRMVFDAERAQPAMLEGDLLPVEERKSEHLQNAENLVKNAENLVSRISQREQRERAEKARDESGIRVTTARIIPTRAGIVAVPDDPALPVYHAGEGVSKVPVPPRETTPVTDPLLDGYVIAHVRMHGTPELLDQFNALAALDALPGAILPGLVDDALVSARNDINLSFGLHNLAGDIARSDSAIIDYAKVIGSSMAASVPHAEKTRNPMSADVFVSDAPATDDARPDALETWRNSIIEAIAYIRAALAEIDLDQVRDAEEVQHVLDRIKATENSAVVTAPRRMARELGDALVGNTVAEATYRSAENAELNKAMGALHDMEKTAQERLVTVNKARGKQTIKDLSADAPLAEYAAAVFLAEYGRITHPDQIERILADIENRNVDHLQSLIGRNSQNTASQRIFERATGIKLGKTQKERVRQIDAWAEISPEQRRATDSTREADRRHQQRMRDVRDTWEPLSRIQVQVADGSILNAQDYVQKMVADGYATAVAVKRGAAREYRLMDAERNTRSLGGNRQLNRFLFNVLALEHGGNVAAAMRLAGIDIVPDLAPSAPLPEETITPEQAEALNHLFGMGNAPAVASPVEVTETVPATSPDQPIVEEPPMATAADTEEDVEENPMANAEDDEWVDLEDEELGEDTDPEPAIGKQPVPASIALQVPDLFSPLAEVVLEPSYTNDNGVFADQHTTAWKQGDNAMSRVEVSVARDRQGSYHGAIRLPNSSEPITLDGMGYATFQEAHMAHRGRAVERLLQEAGANMATASENHLKIALARAVAAHPDGDSITTNPPYLVAGRGDEMMRLVDGDLPDDAEIRIRWWATRYRPEDMPTLLITHLDEDLPAEWYAVLIADNLGSARRPEDVLAAIPLPGTLADFVENQGHNVWNSAEFQAVLSEEQRQVVATQPMGDTHPQLWTNQPIASVDATTALRDFPFWPRNAEEGAHFPEANLIDSLGNAQRYAALKFVDEQAGHAVTIAVIRDDQGFVSEASGRFGNYHKGLDGLNVYRDQVRHYATFDEAAKAGIQSALKVVREESPTLMAAIQAWQKGEPGEIEPLVGGVDRRFIDEGTPIRAVVVESDSHLDRMTREDAPTYSVSSLDSTGETLYRGTFRKREDAEILINHLVTHSEGPKLVPWSAYLAQQRETLIPESLLPVASVEANHAEKPGAIVPYPVQKPENLPERTWEAVPAGLRGHLLPMIEKLLGFPMRHDDLHFQGRNSGNKLLSMNFIAPDGVRANLHVAAYQDQHGEWIIERQRLRFTDVFAVGEHKVYPFLQKLQAAGLYDQVDTVETRDSDLLNGTPAVTVCAVRDRTQLDELVALRGMKPMEVLATVSLTGDAGFESDGRYAAILEKKLGEAADQLDKWKRAFPDNPLRLVVVAVDEDGTQQEHVVAARRQMVRDILGAPADVLRVQDDLQQVRFSAAVAQSDAVMVLGDPLEDKEAKQWIDKNFRAEDKKKFIRATWVYAPAFTELHQEKLVDQVMNRWKYKRMDNEKTAALAQSVPQAVVPQEVPPVRSVSAIESAPVTVHAQVPVPAAAIPAAVDPSPAVTASTENLPTNPEEGATVKPVRLAMPEEVIAYIEPLAARVSQHVGADARNFTMVLDGVVPANVPTNRFTLDDTLEPAHFGFVLRNEGAGMPIETLIDLPPFDVVMNSQIAEIVAERVGAAYENRNMKRIGEMMTAPTAEAALWRIRNTDQPRDMETGEKVDMTTVKALRTDRQVNDAGVWREATIVDRQTLLASGDPDALLGDRWVLMADTTEWTVVMEEARNKEVVTATAKLVSAAFGGIPMLDGYANRAAAVMEPLPSITPAPSASAGEARQREVAASVPGASGDQTVAQGDLLAGTARAADVPAETVSAAANTIEVEDADEMTPEQHQAIETAFSGTDWSRMIDTVRKDPAQADRDWKNGADCCYGLREYLFEHHEGLFDLMQQYHFVTGEDSENRVNSPRIREKGQHDVLVFGDRYVIDPWARLNIPDVPFCFDFEAAREGAWAKNLYGDTSLWDLVQDEVAPAPGNERGLSLPEPTDVVSESDILNALERIQQSPQWPVLADADVEAWMERAVRVATSEHHALTRAMETGWIPVSEAHAAQLLNRDHLAFLVDHALYPTGSQSVDMVSGAGRAASVAKRLLKTPPMYCNSDMVRGLLHEEAILQAVGDRYPSWKPMAIEDFRAEIAAASPLMGVNWDQLYYAEDTATWHLVDAK